MPIPIWSRLVCHHIFCCTCLLFFANCSSKGMITIANYISFRRLKWPQTCTILLASLMASFLIFQMLFGVLALTEKMISTIRTVEKRLQSLSKSFSNYKRNLFFSEFLHESVVRSCLHFCFDITCTHGKMWSFFCDDKHTIAALLLRSSALPSRSLSLPPLSNRLSMLFFIIPWTSWTSWFISAMLSWLGSIASELAMLVDICRCDVKAWFLLVQLVTLVAELFFANCLSKGMLTIAKYIFFRRLKWPQTCTILLTYLMASLLIYQMLFGVLAMTSTECKFFIGYQSKLAMKIISTIKNSRKKASGLVKEF